MLWTYQALGMYGIILWYYCFFSYLVVQICLVALCPCLCAAWFGGAFASNFLFNWNFLNMDNEVIVLRFTISPDVPGFCTIVTTLCLILFSYSCNFIVTLIFFVTFSDPYFKNFAIILSLEFFIIISF